MLEGVSDLYDPSLGSTEPIPGPNPSPSPVPATQDRPILRLLVLQSTVFPKRAKLVIVDSHSELHIGRDASTDGCTPRIRLREMEVSKHHATIFWDTHRKEWAVVDMGSKHGSFLALGGQSDAGSRLSATRMASIPRVLHHLDRLTIGSTTFLVHIHLEMLPCIECSASSDARNEVDLFSVPRNEGKRSRTSDKLEDDRPQDPKKALILLKKSLLNQHRDSPAPTVADSYIDRSAQRRARHPATAMDAPGAFTTSHNDVSVRVRSSARPSPRPIVYATPDSVPAPPIPLAASNVGHRLLMKQGWEPGTALGQTPGRVEPVEVNANVKRTGLGMVSQSATDSNDDWREIGKQKRWQSRAFSNR